MDLPGCGYRLVGRFSLPEDFWWSNYYALIEARIDALRCQITGNRADLKVLDREQRAVDLYKRHARWYGSAFVVMQKSDRKEVAG